MTDIKLYRDYWLTIKARILGIRSVLLVRTEAEMKSKVGLLAPEEIFMVIVVPSADTSAPDFDNIHEKETAIVYAMKKVARVNQTDESAVDDMQVMQQVIRSIKQLMLADAENHGSPFHRLLKEIDFSRMHTDPEYNFLESDGYSISFVLTTKGF